MNDTEPFADGDSTGNDAPYAWLDEWLCEYVDGTMDPALEAIFEQYVEANSDLKAHVERLRETRRMLCECRPPNKMSCETRERVCNRVQEKVCSQVESDLLRSQAPLTSVLEHSTAVVTGLSISTVALVLGVFVGSVLFGPSATPPPTVSADAPERVERTAPSLSLQAPAARFLETPGLSPVHPRHTFSDTAVAPASLPLTTIDAP
jgi:anti-sigma factor RsiW